MQSVGVPPPIDTASVVFSIAPVLVASSQQSSWPRKLGAMFHLNLLLLLRRGIYCTCEICLSIATTSYELSVTFRTRFHITTNMMHITKLYATIVTVQWELFPVVTGLFIFDNALIDFAINLDVSVGTTG